jgi:hypothetical protein
MHLSKDDIPVRLSVPGATARQLPNFGEPEGTFGVEYFSLATGTDMAPLLAGLADDMCHAEHWGYLTAGTVVVDYLDGTAERLTSGEVFYWPAGHTVRVEADAELIMFSPQVEHGEVMEHIGRKIAAMA